MSKLADVGVFGGSGFYKFLDDIKDRPKSSSGRSSFYPQYPHVWSFHSTPPLLVSTHCQSLYVAFAFKLPSPPLFPVWKLDVSTIASSAPYCTAHSFWACANASSSYVILSSVQPLKFFWKCFLTISIAAFTSAFETPLNSHPTSRAPPLLFWPQCTPTSTIATSNAG